MVFYPDALRFKCLTWLPGYSSPKNYSLHYDDLTAGICLPFGGYCQEQPCWTCQRTSICSLYSSVQRPLKCHICSYRILLCQGTYYHGMGRTWMLYLISHIFKRYINECHKILILSTLTVDCPKSGPGQVQGYFCGPGPGPPCRVRRCTGPGPGPQRTGARGASPGPGPSYFFF